MISSSLPIGVELIIPKASITNNVTHETFFELNIFLNCL